MESGRCRLTVLTPTYNRKAQLPNLFDSLNRQTVKGFQWLVIDDGSTDDTVSYLAGLSPDGFCLDHFRKQNGGKHTALNYAHPYIRGDFVCIVDSDDQLLPDAVEAICAAVERYGSDPSIAVFSFQREDPSGKPLVAGMPSSPVVSNHIEYRLNGRRFGDCSEVIRADVLREFPFPEHPGERFVSEGYLWVQIGKKYRTVYFNQAIYRCDYLEGGLTKSGRSMRLKSPLGGMDVCNAFLSARKGPRLSFRLTEKQLWMYVCYGKYAGYSYRKLKANCQRPGLMTVNYPIGLLLHQFFVRKYG